MVPDFTERSVQIEIMDDLGSSGAVVEGTLGELDTINQWLGGNSVTMQALNRVVRGSNEKLRIADLGCGPSEDGSRGAGAQDLRLRPACVTRR